MWFVGLDVHKVTSSVCILDENGKVVKQTKLRGPFSVVVDLLRGLRKRFAVCYEASCGYGYSHDRLRRLSGRVVVAYIDDAARFTQNKKVGRYFGLVPCQDASADVNRLGHITREGPGTVRKVLTEAAWQGVRRSPQIRRFFERIEGGDPKRKKIAVIATAHYLIRVMHATLRTGEVWRQEAAQKKAA